jgi:uncharacterized protein
VRIHLPTYPPGVHRISESVEPQDLNLDSERFVRPIQANLTLDRHDPYLQFDFDLAADVRLECDRCLTMYDYRLHAKSPMLYVLGRPQAAESNDDPDISYLPAGTVDVDVTTDLRDFLILALPERQLCREDCKGLCPQCGADWNVQSCEHFGSLSF